MKHEKIWQSSRCVKYFYKAFYYNFRDVLNSSVIKSQKISKPLVLCEFRAFFVCSSLQCFDNANQTGTMSLPSLSQPSFSLLYVHNLPIICDKTLQNAVRLRLRRLSDNCGGKVQSMSQGTAVLRFGSPEAAARALKRMENEDVFGHRISLSSTPRPRDGVSPEAKLQARTQTFQTKVSVLAPFPTISSSSSSFLPLEKPRSPRRPRRATRPLPISGLVPERPYSPRRGSSGPPGGAPAKPHQVSRLLRACLPPTSPALCPCLGWPINRSSLSSPQCSHNCCFN